MFKKKLVFIISMALLAVLTLSSPLYAKVTIRYMGGWDASTDWPQVQADVAEFNKSHPDIEVIAENVPDYQQKYLIQMAAGNPPDVVYAYKPTAHTHASKGAFLDIGPFLEKDKKEVDPNDFYPGMLDEWRFKGVLYGLPTWTAASGIYYNRDIFDKAGIKYPNDTWTWDTLVENGEKLTIKDAQGKITQYAFTPDGFSLNWGTGPIIWVWSNGGDILSPDKKKFTLGEPKAKQALEYFYDVIFKHQISVTPSAHSEQNWWIRFFNGTVAMWDSPSWNNTYLAPITKFYWDIAPTFLSPYTKKRAGFIHTRATCISKLTKHPEESWEFVKFLSSKQIQRVWAVKRGYQPTRKSIAPIWLKEFKPGGKARNLTVFHKAIYTAKYVPQLDDGQKDADFRRLINTEWEGVMLQKQTIDQFLNKVSKEVTKYLQ